MKGAFFCICVFVAATVLAEDDVEKRIKEIAALEKAGKSAEATERSSVLTNEHPDNVPALYQFWGLIGNDRKWFRQEAVENRAMAMTPKDAKSSCLLGIIVTMSAAGRPADERERRQSKAIMLFKRATELDPKDSDAWFNLASACAERDAPDLKTAREAYGKYIALRGEREPLFEKQIQWKP